MTGCFVSRGESFAALAIANERRLATARFRERMDGLERKEAQVEVARLLIEGLDEIGHITIYTVLMAVPTMGEVKVRRLLERRSEHWYVWPFKRVGELSERQRMRIAGELVVLASRSRR